MPGPRRLGALLTLVCFSAACTAPAEEEAPAEVAEPTELAAEQEPPPELRRFLPDQMQRSTRPETFAHEAHVSIDCRVCHEAVRGHVTHTELTCAECHRAGALSTVREVPPDECQLCHHVTELARGCAACHEVPDVRITDQQLSLTVWEAPRTRALPFDHAVHESQSCESCHRIGTELQAEPCASCHEEHHTEQSRCATCHLPVPEGAHDAAVHLTCLGSGCHSDEGIERIAETRTVCLSCHGEQEDHEPEGVCTECHVLRGAPMSPSGHAEAATATVWRILAGARR